MSDAREKALAAYQATFPEGCVGTETIRDDFTAGWDAAKADLPSQETLASVIADAFIGRTLSGAHERAAAAVLALLRGGE